MPCYHPIHALYRLKPNGKKDIIFPQAGTYEVGNNEFGYKHDGHLYTLPLELPCGQCIGCRLDRSREWANRCMLEAREWPDRNLFVTLTYSDENLVFNSDVPTLVKDDPADFLKRFRSYCKYHFDFDNIRVFYCGEYGSESHRPHYHLILFNLPVQVMNSLVYFKTSKAGYKLFTSDIFDSCWKKGYVLSGECNWETCAYTARYILKKQTGKNSHVYDDLGIVPEFVNMSRRPGIARSHFENNSDRIYEFDKVIIPSGPKGKALECKPPRYYDKLFELDDPETLSLLKDKRRASAVNREREVLSRTSLSLDEYLQLREGNKNHSLSKLIRPLQYDSSFL